MSRIVSLPRSSEEIWKVGKNTLAVIKEENYHDEQNKNNILKLRKILDTLPSFCKDFFRGIEPYTSTRTRLAYAYDIRLFFEFLHEKNSYCNKMEITEFPLSVLDMVQRTDIEEYLDYMSLYQKDGKDITHEERGKARKLSSLRSFYNYYFCKEMITKKEFRDGEYIDKRFVRVRPDVTRNTEVRIILNSNNGFQIAIDGIAKTDGTIGEYVTVENKMYNKTYTSKVIGENRVQVNI